MEYKYTYLILTLGAAAVAFSTDTGLPSGPPSTVLKLAEVTLTLTTPRNTIVIIDYNDYSYTSAI